MSIWESSVSRVYYCTNKKCKCEILVNQKVKDPFVIECPECNKQSLVIKEANLSIQMFIDLSKPKTIGSVAEQNTKLKIKKGESLDTGLMPKKPFWRKNKKKIDYSILKNPNRYISEGIK